MVFELATGDYLFDPKASDEYPRDEDSSLRSAYGIRGEVFFQGTGIER